MSRLTKAAQKKRRVVLLSAFLVPALTLLISYLLIGFYPVGERTPLTIDLYHQYVAFLAELRRKILAGENLFYSWSVGLGTNFYALSAYYVASPLNLLLVLFPHEHLPEAVTFLTVTKIGLSGLSFATLLSFGPFKLRGQLGIRANENLYESKPDDLATDIFTVVLATAYALNGFNLAFSWDIMWLDVIALLPIVILGLNKILREDRFMVYIISLALALIINYYIAFFLCVFVFLYFFVAYFTAKSDQEELRDRLNKETVSFSAENDEAELSELEKYKHLEKNNLELKLLKLKFWPSLGKVVLATVIAFAISAVMLLPTAISLVETSAAGDSFPAHLNFNFDSFDFLGRGLIGNPPSIRSGLPNVYVGILVYIFLPLYIMSKRIPLKEKAAHLALLFFLFFSFNNNYLDFIWHGMHYPNQLPYRYSFLFAFLLLLIAYRTLTVIREYSTKTLLILATVGIGFTILAEKFNEDINREVALLNVIFFVIYIVILTGFRKRHNFRSTSLLLAVVIVGEIAINTLLTVYTIGDDEVYTNRNNFVNDFEQVDDLVAKAKAREEGDFFRMEVIPQKTTNDGALYSYPGFTLFSSTSREKTSKLMRDFGFHGNNINSYKYTGSTPVADSLFGLKYLLLKNGASRDPNLEIVEKNGDMSLLENPYALEVGAVANPMYINFQSNYVSPFSNWNDLLQKLDQEPLFTHIDPTVTTGFNFQPVEGSGSSGLSFRPENLDNSSEMNLNIDLAEDKYVFMAVDVSEDTDVSMRINEDMSGETIPEKDNNTVRLVEDRNIHWMETFNLGYCLAGDSIDISFKQKAGDANTITVYTVTMDKAQYEDTMENLKARALDVKVWDTNYLKADYNAPEAGYLYLSIPFDNSWHAKIDGKEVPIEAIADEALLSVKTPAGEHSLELKFIPQGFYIGLGLSIFGIIVLVLLALFINKKLKPKEKVQAYKLKEFKEDLKTSGLETRDEAEPNLASKLEAREKFLDEAYDLSIEEINSQAEYEKLDLDLATKLKIMESDKLWDKFIESVDKDKTELSPAEPAEGSGEAAENAQNEKESISEENGEKES